MATAVHIDGTPALVASRGVRVRVRLGLGLGLGSFKVMNEVEEFSRESR